VKRDEGRGTVTSGRAVRRGVTVVCRGGGCAAAVARATLARRAGWGAAGTGRSPSSARISASPTPAPGALPDSAAGGASSARSAGVMVMTLRASSCCITRVTKFSRLEFFDHFHHAPAQQALSGTALKLLRAPTAHGHTVAHSTQGQQWDTRTSHELRANEIEHAHSTAV
jgi:hypothetical protein